MSRMGIGSARIILALRSEKGLAELGAKNGWIGLLAEKIRGVWECRPVQVVE